VWNKQPSSLDIGNFRSVLKWLIECCLMDKKPVSGELLYLSYLQCPDKEEQKSFVQLLLGVCANVLTPPVQKLDWIWFNTYIIESAV